MNDYKFTFKLTVITALIVTLLIIISPYLFGYLGLDDQKYHPTVTTVTYDVLRTYDETNQSIYGTWRDYYVVTTEGKYLRYHLKNTMQAKQQVNLHTESINNG